MHLSSPKIKAQTVKAWARCSVRKSYLFHWQRKQNSLRVRFKPCSEVGAKPTSQFRKSEKVRDTSISIIPQKCVLSIDKAKGNGATYASSTVRLTALDFRFPPQVIPQTIITCQAPKTKNAKKEVNFVRLSPADTYFTSR